VYVGISSKEINDKASKVDIAMAGTFNNIVIIYALQRYESTLPNHHPSMPKAPTFVGQPEVTRDDVVTEIHRCRNGTTAG
jgi:hypothetical protein